jgi:hypothetical protein
MLDAHTGALQNWNPAHDGYVLCMILQSGKLIVGGNFTTMAGQPRNGIAIFDAATGALDPISVSQSYIFISALWADSNTIYLTGTSGNGLFLQNFDLTTGIVSGWQSDQVFGEIFTMAKAGNYVYIGGQNMTDYSQANSYCLERYDATTGNLDLTFMANSFIDINYPNPGVWQILPYNNHIYVCGEFELFNNNSADGFLALDSNGNRTSFDIHADSYENYCMFPQGNYLWVGGNSYSFGGQTNYYAAQINLSTGLATCWVNPDQDLLFIGSIYAQEDTVYLGYYWGIGSGMNNAPSGGGGLEMAVGNVATGPVTATITHNIVPCGDLADTFFATPSNPNASVYYEWYGPHGIDGFGQTFVLNHFVTYDSIYLVVTNNLCDQSTYTSPWIQVGITTPAYTTLSKNICQGSSYTFSGQNFTQSGTYYDTLTAQNSCDSIVTLYLIVNPTSSVNLYDTLCSGSSFAFGGHSISQSGIYSDTLTGIHGCDSVVTLYLTVNPTSSTNLYNTICSNSSITFGGHSYSQSGIYTDTLSTVSGCDSLIVLDLTVNPLSSVNLYDTICAGYSFSFGSHSYSQSGIYSDTLSSVYGCDSIVALNLTVNPTSSANLYDTICSNSSVTFGGHNYSQAGIYSDTLTNAHGCDSIITLNLFIHPAYRDTLNITICQGDSFDFNGNMLTTTETQYLYLTTASGCDSTVILHLTVNPTSSINLYDTLITGDTLHLNGHAYTQSGIYYDTLSNVHGCDSAQTIYLYVATTTTFAHLFDTVCQGFSVVVGNHTYTVSGTYVDTLTGTYGGDSVVTLNLTINQALIVNINDTIGQGGSVTVGANTYSQPGTYVDTLMSAAGCDSIVALHLYVTTGIIPLSSLPNVNIYPNPNQGSFTIAVDGISSTTLSAEVIDMLGRSMYKQNIHSGENKLDLSLTPGVYTVRVSDGNTFAVKMMTIK